MKPSCPFRIRYLFCSAACSGTVRRTQRKKLSKKNLTCLHLPHLLATKMQHQGDELLARDKKKLSMSGWAALPPFLVSAATVPVYLGVVVPGTLMYNGFKARGRENNTHEKAACPGLVAIAILQAKRDVLLFACHAAVIRLPPTNCIRNNMSCCLSAFTLAWLLVGVLAVFSRGHARVFLLSLQRINMLSRFASRIPLFVCRFCAGCQEGLGFLEKTQSHPAPLSL